MTADRRQFFRINQQIAMEIRLLADDHKADIQVSQFDVAPSFSVICDLYAQETEAQMLLHRIGQKDPALAQYLQLMSNRMNIMARALVSQDIDFNRLVTRDVNLSEGGMLFYYSEALPVGGHVSVKLIFPGASLGLQMSASILRCDPIETGQFELALTFNRLPESTRTVLARQIMESQALSRRSQIA